uniref:Protein Ycf2 n=1 Tax=Thalassia hemprichii TaxID=55496 RepID=A0A4Y1KF17_9LILI|nr:ycf2 [Thalassia hemprichii]YP_009667434.1 ycf2 [Thalassia hemprichii]ATP74958.1 ycf2 [Thalassia hemprichii]ATP74991.1 ycf2 [Thalassia hemprichii]
MRTHQFQLWISELREVLREIKKSHYLVDSWIKFQSIGSFIHICFHQERFMKLFDPLIVSILLSRDSRGSTSNPYFTIKKGVVLLIKGGVLIVVVVLLSRISNRKMVESQNFYLMELLPIPRNSIGPRNKTLEESFWSSNINRLIVSLLHLPKGNPISENGFFVDPQESTWVLPRNQRNPKCIMPESNRGSRWWRKRVGKKRDSSCKISKETVAGIEISFKEKDSQCVEFLFLSYTDDPIRSWGKNWHESDFLRNVSRENWIWLDNVWLVNKDPFFSKVRNVSSNIQYDSARSRSIFAQVMHWGRWKGSSDPSRALFDSIRNEDSEYHKGIDQTEIQQRKEGSILFPVPEETEEFLGNPSIRSFFSDKWSELHLGSNPTEGSTRDQKFWKKKQDVSFVPFRRRSEEMVDLFKIIRYLQNTVSIHPISSDRGYDMVPQDETSIESSNKTSFWDQNRFLGFFHLFHDRNKGGYTLGHDLESEERFPEMADRFTLSITEPDLVYPRGFAFSRDSYGLDPNQLLNGVFHSRDESKKKSLLVLPPLLISRTERSMNRDPDAYRYKWSNRSKNFQEHLEHFVSEQKTRFQGVFDRFQRGFDLQGVFDRFQGGFDLQGVFDRFQGGFDLQGVFDRFQGGFDLQGVFDRFQGGFDLQGVFDRFQGGFDLQGVFDRFQGGFDLQGVFDRFQGGFDLQGVFDRFQGGFDLQGRFVQFQGVLDRLRKKINPDSMDWFELFDIEELPGEIRFALSLRFFFKEAFPFFLSKSLLFLSKSLLFFFVSIRRNTPIYGSEIHIYEWKDPNDQPRNQLFESIGVSIVHLKKWKPFLFLLDDHDTSQRPKLLIHGGTRFPSGFHKIPKWMIDSFHTRNHRRKSFENTDSYFSMISHDRDNWLNPVKPFHRSSLISSFYKANRLRFLNHPRHFWFHCNKGFPFDVEKTHIHTEDLTYGQFLNISFIRNKIFSLCVGKKKEICLERETISPIELQVSDIFLSKDFPQSGDGTYNLYKSFHFPIRFDPFVRAIYSIADISETPLTEEQMAHLERTDCQPFSDRNLLSDSEGKNLHQYLRFHSNMGFIHTPCPEKSFLPSGNRKKRSLCRKKCVEKWQMYRKGESAFSHFSKGWNLFQSKWNMFQTYMPWFLTSTGCKYLNFTLLDTFSNSLPILSTRLVSIVHGVMYRWGISWPISENEWGAILLKQRNRIRDIFLHNVFLSEEKIHRNHESPLPWIWTRLISTNALESFYLSIFFFLLVAGYFVGIHLLFVSRASREFKTELEKIQSLVIPSYIMELQTLRDQYPPSEPLSFWFKNLFFSRNTRHLSRTSKEIYSLIRERKSVNDGNWIDDKIEFWLVNNDSLHYEEKPFLIQFSTLTTETRMDSILWSLTHSDHLSLSKNDSGYQMNEQPGSIYLRYIVDIHNKSLMNYEFHRSCLAERRIFLAHYQTITYSQTSCGANHFHFPSHGNPFSLRLDLSPSKDILVIGSRGTGRSYLVKYLAANSYVPFITVFSTEYLPDKLPPLGLMNKMDIFDGHGMHIDDRNDDLDTELLTMTNVLARSAKYQHQYRKQLRRPKIERMVITIHLELAKAMSPCIIWIPNIHDLYVKESGYLSRGLLVNYLSRDSERCSTRNFLVIASTHIPQKVDPALIAPDKLNTCIKIRKLLLSQQRKHFFTLSYTRGFHLEKNIFHTQKLGSITMGSNARDLAALVNEALSISITQKKSILETNTIRSALHRQTWDMQAHLRFFHDPGILFYKIGRAVAQNVLLRNDSLDPISIYGKEQSCLYKWCLEFGRSMKKFTIFLYFLSCSAGSVARDLWSPLGPDEIDWITSSSSYAFFESHGFVESDSDLVHGLLEVEGALVGSSRTETDCSQFDNNRVPWLLRSEPRNPLDMMQNAYCSILDRLEDGKGTFDPQQIEEHFFNPIVCWAPRIWRPYGNQVDWIERPGFSDLDRFFREGRTMQYQRRERCSKEEGFFVFGISRCVWDPVDPFFSLFLQDQPLASAFSRRGKLFDEETLKELMTDCNIEMIDNDETEMIHDDTHHLDEAESWLAWVTKKMQEIMAYERDDEDILEPYFDKNTPEIECLIPDQRRWFRAYSSLSLYNHGSFRSKIISESYQYLSNLFLSNGTLLDQMTKTLLRKRWLFPVEMQHLIQDWIQERFPIP